MISEEIRRNVVKSTTQNSKMPMTQNLDTDQYYLERLAIVMEILTSKNVSDQTKELGPAEGVGGVGVTLEF